MGDPLLIKMGGRMTPSPFAERLVDDVRPILRSMPRVLTPLAVADGQIDVAFVVSALKLAEAVATHEAGEIPWATFMRADHPARGAWNALSPRRRRDGKT